MPSGRVGARFALTLTGRAVYMVGGREEGEPAREVWRYDLDAREWSLQFEHQAYLPIDVLAVAYDHVGRRLAVLDEVENPATKKKTVRLVAYDAELQKAALVGSWPRVGKLGRVALTAREDGSFLLTAALSKAATIVFRFKIEKAKVVWSGFRVFPGGLLDDPIYTPDGTVVPLLQGNKQHLRVVADADLLSVPKPCDEF